MRVEGSVFRARGSGLNRNNTVRPLCAATVKFSTFCARPGIPTPVRGPAVAASSCEAPFPSDAFCAPLPHGAPLLGQRRRFQVPLNHTIALSGRHLHPVGERDHPAAHAPGWYTAADAEAAVGGVENYQRRGRDPILSSQLSISDAPFPGIHHTRSTFHVWSCFTQVGAGVLASCNDCRRGFRTREAGW